MRLRHPVDHAPGERGRLALRSSPRVLSEFELEAWVESLLPVLDHFVGAAEGRVDVAFWRSFFHYESSSGPAGRERLSIRNDVQGPSLGEIPSGLSSAPVMFVNLRNGTKHPLRFVAGMFGVTQEVTSGSPEPEFGWAIVHELG